MYSVWLNKWCSLVTFPVSKLLYSCLIGAFTNQHRMDLECSREAVMLPASHTLLPGPASVGSGYSETLCKIQPLPTSLHRYCTFCLSPHPQTHSKYGRFKPNWALKRGHQTPFHLWPTLPLVPWMVHFVTQGGECYYDNSSWSYRDAKHLLKKVHSPIWQMDFISCF